MRHNDANKFVKIILYKSGRRKGKNMERNSRKGGLWLTLLLVALVGLGGAFALFNTTLNISGNGTIAVGSWDIHFEKDGFRNSPIPGIASDVDDVIVNTTATLDALLVSGIDVDFTAPGYVTYEFDVANKGAYDAVLDSIDVTSLAFGGSGAEKDADETLVGDNFVASLTYKVGGAAVAENDTLLTGETKTLVLKLEYTGATMPARAVQVSGLSYALNYVQD